MWWFLLFGKIINELSAPLLTTTSPAITLFLCSPWVTNISFIPWFFSPIGGSFLVPFSHCSLSTPGTSLGCLLFFIYTHSLGDLIQFFFFFQFFGSQLKSNKLHVFHTTDLKSDQAFTWSYHQHNLDNKCFYPPSKISLLPLVIFHF